MNKKRYALASTSLLLCYVLAYGYFRSSGAIVHFQNLGEPSGSEVKASLDPWDEVFSGMATNSGSWVLKAKASFDRAKPAILNGAFWPLREMECAYWNIRKPEAGGPGRSLPQP